MAKTFFDGTRTNNVKQSQVVAMNVKTTSSIALAGNKFSKSLCFSRKFPSLTDYYCTGREAVFVLLLVPLL